MQGPIHTTCLIFILPVLLCSSCYKENEPPQIQSTTADPETIKTGDTGYWWSATQYNSHNAWYRYLHYSSPDFRKNNYSKDYGFSVRCVRD